MPAHIREPWSQGSRPVHVNRLNVLGVPPKAELLRWAEALRTFDRPALVAWASEDRVMPPEHGRRLAGMLPRGELVEIADSYTLIPEDRPGELVRHLVEFMRNG